MKQKHPDNVKQAREDATKRKNYYKAVTKRKRAENKYALVLTHPISDEETPEEELRKLEYEEETRDDYEELNFD